MELTVLAAQAVGIVLYVLDKSVGGALEKAGADLVDFLRNHLKGKVSVESAREESKLLEAVIISEALSNKSFHSNLEKFVSQFQQVQGVSSQANQNTESGVNISVTQNLGEITAQKFFR